jgi:hypothetical protein
MKTLIILAVGAVALIILTHERSVQPPLLQVDNGPYFVFSPLTARIISTREQ